jgi:hypothetical protein
MAEIVDHYRVDGDTKSAQKAVEQLKRSTATAYRFMGLKLEIYGAKLGELAKKHRASEKIVERSTAVMRSAWAKLNQEFEKGLVNYRERLKTTEQMTRALRGAGYEAEQNVDALNAMAGALELNAGVSDEASRALYSLALNTGVGLENVQSFTTAAIRMSKALDVSVVEAMRQLAKTQQGLAEETIKLIPGVGNLTKEQLKAGKAAELVNTHYADMLELSDNLNGKITKLANAKDSFFEELAGGVADTSLVTFAIDDLTKALESMSLIMEKGGGLAEGLYRALSFVGGGAATITARAAELGGEAPGLVTERDEYARERERLTREREANLAKFQERQKAALEKDREAREKRRRAGKSRRETEDRRKTLWEQFQAERELYEQNFTEGKQDKEELQISQWERENQLRDEQMGLIREQWERQAEWEKSIKEKIAKDEIIAEAEKQAKLEAIRKQGMDTAMGTVQEFAGATLEALVMMAEGEEGAFERAMKMFLRNTGMKLVGQGIADVWEGVARAPRHWYADPTAYEMVGLGAGEIAAGTAMIGGSLAISPPGAGGGGGGGATVGGGTAGAGGTEPRRPREMEEEGPVVINVFSVGKLGPEQVRLIQDSMADARARGY